MLSISQIPLLSSVVRWGAHLSPLDQGPIVPSIKSYADSCPTPPILSCPFPPPTTVNTCCLNHPSGHFLQTQFWDTSPALGPNDSWTIHGLWPDLCTGGFDQFCDASRSADNIRSLLESMHSNMTRPLLDFMEKYWLSLDGRDERLWAHEWNKHGTCISTLEPSCYSSHTPSHEDMLDYFVQTTSLFKTLDTYHVLADAGILPSTTARYALQELEDAIESSPHGFPVTFRCNHYGELDEIWYHFSVRGSLRTSPSASPLAPFLNATSVRDLFIPTGPDGAKSNCPSQGIKYLPKGKLPGNPSPTRSSSPPTSTPTSPPFIGRGFLEVHTLDGESDQEGVGTAATSSTRHGCLIRLGAWYTSGACATFHTQRDVVDPGHAPLFSLASRYSPCLVDPTSQKFECTKSSGIQSIFSSDPHDPSVLSYRNSTTFYANRLPGRFEKMEIYADDGDGSRPIAVEIHWVAV